LNPAEREILADKRSGLDLRCQVLRSIRSFFEERGFLEVDTPVRTTAPAPERHIEAIAAEDGHFLVTSPELYMKRLLAAGYEKVFQVSHVFRKGERGRRHLPEFTLLEWYRAGSTYLDLQTDCRDLLTSVCRASGRSKGWFYLDEWLSVDGEWDKYTVREAFSRFAGWEPGNRPDEDRFDRDLVEKIEPRLGFPRPCFLSDYPSSQAALARLKEGDPTVAERFEMYWAGIELANGFSELTDATEQLVRFHETLEERQRAGLARYPLPEAFLKSLEHLPPCAGIALGVDRLIMLLAGASSLDSIVAFPPELDGP
jgi:lysyl-tRNA synthetase class 2